MFSLLVSLTMVAQTPQAIAPTAANDTLKKQKQLTNGTVQLQEVVITGRNEARKLRESGMPVSVMVVWVAHQGSLFGD